MQTIHEHIRFNLRRIRRAKDFTQLYLAVDMVFLSQSLQRLEVIAIQSKRITITAIAVSLGVNELDFVAIDREIRLDPKPGSNKNTNSEKRNFSKSKLELLASIEKADERTVETMLSYLKFISTPPLPSGPKPKKRPK